MMETASSFWSNVPGRIFGCCGDNRQDIIEDIDININRPEISNRTLDFGNPKFPV